MKKRRLIDFYLPFPWNIHARIMFVSITGSLIFKIFIDNSTFLQSFLTGFFIMMLDTEIIFWVSRVLFNSIKKTVDPKEATFQILWRVGVFLLLIIGVGTLVGSSVILVMNLIYGNSFHETVQLIRQFELEGMVKSLGYASLVATMAFFFILWQEAMKSAFKAREQALIYQSETLKNQVNPHFLFNSLNTLSSLIPTDPEKAEQFTQRLSVIYRYILENRDVEIVPLKQEIDFVNDYFYLQKIRDEEKIELSISVKDPGSRIIPISIQLLVENAFKHNIATRENPLKVTIVQKGDWIEVSNNLQPRKQLTPSSGLGLKNLTERILLQTGRNLTVENTGKEFIVKVPLVN